MQWRNTTNGELHGYDYTYDDLGRMTDARYTSFTKMISGYYDEIVSYNPNGSITSLQRSGMKNNGTFGLIDDLTISYDGNRLVKVTDDAEALNYNGALDFNDGANADCEYQYDSNGALTYDSNRGINCITYDYGHHPSEISMMAKKMTLYNDYTPDGRKLSSRHYGMVPKGNGSYRRLNTTDLYIDGLILRDGVPFMWRFDGGYVDLNANGTPTSWNYYITDHLGSTRMIVDSNDNIRETINYYPYGSEMQMVNPALLTGGISHPFRFTGKELDRQNSLNMYDFGARWYDVAGVPMWTSVDPLAEKYYNISPYVYCHNNPINRIDIDGLYDFEGISNWSNPIIAVFPVAELRDETIQLDYQSAHDASVPIITVADIEDFGVALSDLKQKGIPFESIAINSHGNYNGFKIGSEEVNLTSDLSGIKEGLEDKTLFVGACDVGKNNILVNQIAEDTQSTVIAPQHKLPAGYQYDGSNFLNILGKSYIPTYSPAQYYVSNGNTSKTVTNVTIDKNNGIKWDGFMPTFNF